MDRLRDRIILILVVAIIVGGVLYYRIHVLNSKIDNLDKKIQTLINNYDSDDIKEK